MRNVLLFISTFIMMLATSVSAQNEYIVSRVGSSKEGSIRFGPLNGWTVLSSLTDRDQQVFLYGPNGYVREVTDFEEWYSDSDSTSIQELGPDGTLYLTRIKFTTEVVVTTFYRLPVGALELQAFHSLREKNRHWSYPAVGPMGQIGIIRPVKLPRSPRYQVELITNGISTFVPVQFRARRKSNYEITSQIFFSSDGRFYVQRYAPPSSAKELRSRLAHRYEICFMNFTGAVECHQKSISIVEKGERLTLERPGIYRGEHSFSLINESTGETLLRRSFGSRSLSNTALMTDGVSFVAGLGGYSKGKFGPEILSIHRVSGNDEKFRCDPFSTDREWLVDGFSVLNSDGVLILERVEFENGVGLPELIQLIPSGVTSGLPGTKLGVCKAVQ